MSSLDYLDLCRLCLVKDRVSVPIFEGEGDVRQIFLKIAACLPVKVAREDKLPKKICNDCVYKVELFYQFWNTTVNAEKQLLQWLGEVSLEDKQGYVTNVLNPSIMKQEQSTENRLDGNVMQQVGEHQNNMGMGMIDNMGLGIPMMISSANQQQITSVPMDTSSNSVQAVQAVPGPSSQATHNQISQNQTNTTQQEDEEESSEDEDNSDEECDGDEGLPVKEESEEDPSNRTIEPTTFVNVSLACDEAGPSGLQQQKISDLPEMPIPQPADGDPKSGPKSVKTVPARTKLSRAVKSKEGDRSNVVVEEITDNSCTVQEIESYKCESCDEEFDSKAAVLVHRTEQSILRTREALKKTEKKYTCDVCCESFAKKMQLFRHRRIRCKESALEASKQNTSKDKTVKSKRKEQTSTGPIECNVCHKVFKKKKYLNVHKTLHGAPHICHVCGAKLTSEYYLKIHIRRHNKEFTEFCEVCNKGFYLKATLKTHMSVHSEDKPCICEICHKSFGNRVYLRSHMKIHSQPESRKKYKCEICGFETFYSYCYKEHLWTHTGESQVACEVCGKLIRRQYMKIHIRIHTGEKPEICEFCGKAFSSRKYLIKHRRTHTGERPYKCKICDKRFTQRGTLSAHLRRHEGAK